MVREDHAAETRYTKGGKGVVKGEINGGGRKG